MHYFTLKLVPKTVVHIIIHNSIFVFFFSAAMYGRRKLIVTTVSQVTNGKQNL